MSAVNPGLVEQVSVCLPLSACSAAWGAACGACNASVPWHVQLL